jgi:hypothetical protein
MTVPPVPESTPVVLTVAVAVLDETLVAHVAEQETAQATWQFADIEQLLVLHAEAIPPPPSA